MTVEVFHVNPETGRPNVCRAGDACEFGGADFHYDSKHDAEVAWKARQLERGIIAYRSVMQAREKKETDNALASLAEKASGAGRKMSISVVRSLIQKNISKYAVNFFGLFISWAIVSGQWLRDDWVRRVLPIMAVVVAAGLTVWWVAKIAKGSRKTARVVKKRRAARSARRPARP